MIFFSKDCPLDDSWTDLCALLPQVFINGNNLDSVYSSLLEEGLSITEKLVHNKNKTKKVCKKRFCIL